MAVNRDIWLLKQGYIGTTFSCSFMVFLVLLKLSVKFGITTPSWIRLPNSRGNIAYLSCEKGFHGDRKT